MESSKKGLIIPFGSASRLYRMKDLVINIFHLDGSPDDRQITRQLYTSLTNYLFPKNVDILEDVLCAEDAIAESNGHSVQTQLKRYGTIIGVKGEQIRESENERLERQHDEYHYSIGEKRPVAIHTRSRIINENRMLETLNVLYGPGSIWLSTLQKKKRNKYMQPKTSHAGWRKLWWWEIGNLGASHYEALAERTRLYAGFRVVLLTAKDIQEDRIRNIFEPISEIPHVVLATIDAMALFVCQHWMVLKSLKPYIHRVIVDEVHTILLETFWWSASYSCLQNLIGLGLPVIIMSGSLPLIFGRRILSHLGLENAIEYTVDDLIGNIGFCLTIQQEKQEVIGTLNLIQNNEGDSSDKELSNVARDWRKANGRVLITTTIGLTGIDLTSCDFVIIMGVFYNILSVLQGIGRIRPQMRSDIARVVIVTNGIVWPDQCDNDNAQLRKLIRLKILRVEDEYLFKRLCSVG
eukprot:scaffold56148_cov27-Attheya_sp.AAC.1